MCIGNPVMVVGVVSLVSEFVVDNGVRVGV